MNLESELTKAEQAIASDSYSMSVGELVSSYNSGEIELNPQFQRFFRWNDYQKTRLIESFLLGLPIPPIFVFQKSSGQWELIDGLQRVSTILEVMGELKTKDGGLMPPLVLTESKYLPSLKGVAWKPDVVGATEVLPDALKLRLRKSRIDVKIILPKSNEVSKFELFDRLNTGGSEATPQEVRNCLLLMEDPTFLNWLDELSKHPSFISSIPLTEKQIKEQYNLELLIRFIVLQRTTEDEAKRIPDLETYLNEMSLQLATDKTFDRSAEAEIFKKTFDLLDELFGDGAFRRPKANMPDKYIGPFLLAAFEIIAIGTALNLDTINTKGKQWLRDRINELWQNDLIKSIGMRASQRLGHTIPLARNHFTA
ncbi:MAG: DUF262 domain-containing protein [Methylobacter sp.]